MKSYSPEEIKNIEQLLLSSDNKNVLLGLNFIEHNRSLIPSLIKALEVLTVFRPEFTDLLAWMQEYDTSYKPSQCPIYALKKAHRDRALFKKNIVWIKQFLEHGDSYERHVTVDSKRAVYYFYISILFKEDLNNFPKANELAQKYARIGLKYVSEFAYFQKFLADILLDYPPKRKTKLDYKDEIISLYKKAYELEPIDETLCNLGATLGDFKLYTEAEEILLDCIERYPMYNRTHSTLSWHYYKTNNWDKARHYAKESIEVGLKNKITSGLEHPWHTLGMIAWKGSNNLRRAKVCFEEALKVNPNHSESKNDLRKVEKLLDKA